MTATDLVACTLVVRIVLIPQNPSSPNPYPRNDNTEIRRRRLFIADFRDADTAICTINMKTNYLCLWRQFSTANYLKSSIFYFWFLQM